MYLLEGLSRWNHNRSQQALGMSGTSRTKMYDVRLMSSVNVLGNRVLGSGLLPEFIPPGKPTGKILWQKKRKHAGQYSDQTVRYYLKVTPLFTHSFYFKRFFFLSFC